MTSILIVADHFPDSSKDIVDWLLEIDTKARKLKKKEFQDIKEKLIAFATPMDQIDVNTLLKSKIELFVKDKKAFNLVEEIREIISKIQKEKSKKKKT